MPTFKAMPLELLGPDPALEGSIGRAFLAWSALEHEIDDALRIALMTEERAARCVAANLGIKARLDILQALLHEYLYNDLEEIAAGLPEPFASQARNYTQKEVALLRDAEALVQKTQSLASSSRNWIAHGRPVRCPNDSCGQWMWTRYSARKGGLHSKIEALSAEKFDDLAGQTKELAGSWQKLNDRLALYMSAISDVDFLADA